MKKKFSLVAGFLTLFIGVFFFSCSKDVYEDSSTSQLKESFVLKKVSLNDLALKNNEKLMKNVNFIKSLKKTNETSRLIYNPELDFYLDEKNGKYAESSEGHSYTFPIFKDTDSEKVKNLVFVSQPNGEYKTLLFDYNLTKEQMDNLTQTQIANLPYEVFTVDETTTAATFGKQTACFQIWVWDRIEMHQGDNTGGPLWYWGWVLAYDGCAGGGGSDDSSSGGSGDSSTSGSDSGSDSGTSTGNTGTSGSSNAPGGGSSSTGNTVITSPNSGLSPKQYQFLKQLNPLSAGDTFGQLDETTQNHVLTYVNGLSANLAINTTAHFFNTTNMLWLINQSAATQVSIVDYLIQNNFSSSSTTFINNLINLAENNDSVEIVPYASSNVMNFQNTSEFNNYVQDLLTDNLTDNTSSSGLDLGSQFSTSKIVEVTNIHDVKFDLVINKSPFSLAQCNSYLYNTIPGNSWVQSTSAMSSTATSATVTIVGYINVGVNLGGNNGAIGIKFSKRIRLFVSTNNGAINGSWVQND